MKRLTRHIYPGLICGVIIMILCGLPGSCFPTVQTFWEWLGPDKIVHTLMFAVLAYAIIWGYRQEYQEGDKAYKRRLRLITFLISSAYGALTEILQVHVFIGRYGSKYDFFADVIGCVLGLCVFKIFFRKNLIKNSSDIQ